MPLVQLEYLLTCPRFPKFQDVPEEYTFDHTNRPPALIAVCHRWESEHDPDPQGGQLAEFKEYIHELRSSNLLSFLHPSEAKTVGVFYDYSALPQPERSSEGQALYEEELKSIHKYFAVDPARPAVDPNPIAQFALDNFSLRAHAQANSKHIGLVLARSSRGGLRGMFKRAWCYLELSAMARSGTLLIPDSQRDNSRILFDEGPVHELQQFKHMDFREHGTVDEAITDLMKTLMGLNVTVDEDRMLCLERTVDQFALVMPDYYFRNNLKAQFQKVQQQAANPPKSSCLIS